MHVTDRLKTQVNFAADIGNKTSFFLLLVHTPKWTWGILPVCYMKSMLIKKNYLPLNYHVKKHFVLF